MSDYYSRIVNRFLGWKLPDDFAPDCGISFKRTHSEFSPFGPQKHEPVGTNLLTAVQARAMLEHILPPMPNNGYATEAEGDAYTHGWFDGNEADPYGLPRWRHKKRGTYYTELGTARLQLASPVVIEEGAVLMIYRGDDGVLWARPEAEFKDGRFERITDGVGGTLDGLSEVLLELRPMTAYGVVGSRDVDQARYRAAIDRALLELAARSGSAAAIDKLAALGVMGTQATLPRELLQAARDNLRVCAYEQPGVKSLVASLDAVLASGVGEVRRG